MGGPITQSQLNLFSIKHYYYYWEEWMQLTATQTYSNYQITLAKTSYEGRPSRKNCLYFIIYQDEALCGFILFDFCGQAESFPANLPLSNFLARVLVHEHVLSI